MRLSAILRVPVIVVLSCASLAAQATTSYCAGSVAQLQEALDQAEVDGDDSLVRMRSGSYALGADLVYAPEFEYLIPPGRLTLRGGYDADCSSYSLATGATTFEGGGARGLRIVTEASSVSVLGLGFASAFLEMSGEAPNGSLVDECSVVIREFEMRRLRVDQGSIEVEAPCQDVLLENSLLTNGVRMPGSTHASDTALGARLFGFDDVASASLTMVNSTVSNGRVSLRTCCGDGTTPSARLYNSIFNRAAGDDIFSDVPTLAVNNRYDGITFGGVGGLVPGSTNNVASSPGLNAQFVPDPGSAMIDTGTSNVPGGLPDVDLAGSDRIIGFNVDRGALESPVDGTGVYTVTTTAASGAGSLANAIALANADVGLNTIRFAIAGTCPRRITVDAALQVRETLTIDGWTQPGSVQNSLDFGFNAVPCVVLDGGDRIGVGIETLPDIGIGRLSVRGLAFEDFSTAILLPYGEDHAIYGNQFGGRIGNTAVTLTGNANAITLATRDSVIGGLSDSARNLIGGSDAAGIVVAGASTDGNEIINNLIGLDKNGTSALPNEDGIRIAASGTRVRQNRIGGNTRDGVVLRGSNGHDNVVDANLIGGSASPLLPVAPNQRAGVLLEEGAFDNRIGPDNAMFANGDSAVRVLATAGGFNEITANRIDLNDSPGIDLGANGTSANDADPQFCGTGGCAANRGQNFPLLQTIETPAVAPVGRPVRIAGRLTSTIGGPYRIELFASDACYASGHGQGARFLGSVEVSIANAGLCNAGNCSAAFATFVSAAGLEHGDVVTATATSAPGDTSEFSACLRFDPPDGSELPFADGFE